MSIYYRALKKYFRGQLRDAANDLHKAGCEYLYNGDVEKAKEAFYYAGRALYDYQRTKKRRVLDISFKDLVLAILYFKLSDSRKDLLELIDIARKLAMYRKDIDLQSSALVLFVSALEGYDIKNTLNEIDELISLWNESSKKLKHKTMGAYILLQISRNIILGRREVVKSLWLRYKEEIFKTYPKFFDLLEIIMLRFLGE